MKARTAYVAKIIFAALCLTLFSQSAAVCQLIQTRPDVFPALKHDVSPPLRDIKSAPPVPGPPRVNQRLFARPPKITPYQPDPALQRSRGPLVSATPGLAFEGIDEVSQQAMSGFLSEPPDTNGAMGATQFVQWVNYAWAVFDKTTGNLVKNGGPFAGNILWANSPTFVNSQCATNNSGDPIAQYDKAANRWVLTQPVFTKPFAICVAVSTSDDATGSYNLYEFPMPGFPDLPGFPDYPKLGVWPDGYYMSMDLYTQGLGFGGKFKGPYLCAFDRSAMLAGASASMVCFQLSSDFPHLLPSDLDGNTPPPAGSPNFFVNFEKDLKSSKSSLNLWKFHVDFSTPANSTFTGPTNIPVAVFNEACGGGICIPQLNSNRLLDSLGDRLMYRLAYRNYGDHESLVVNHSVSVPTGAKSSVVGVRWYEIRNPRSCSPDPHSTQYCIYQQNTFAPPDGNFRWMGSVAMDKFGDIAVGYSVSSSSIHPSIGFTGRVPSDPLNTLETEIPIIIGGGSQTNVNNWGDYSSMSIDPVDDCTFWYTTEYLPAPGNYNWSTRIASFKFPSCR